MAPCFAATSLSFILFYLFCAVLLYMMMFLVADQIVDYHTLIAESFVFRGNRAKDMRIIAFIANDNCAEPNKACRLRYNIQNIQNIYDEIMDALFE